MMKFLRHNLTQNKKRTMPRPKLVQVMLLHWKAPAAYMNTAHGVSTNIAKIVREEVRLERRRPLSESTQKDDGKSLSRQWCEGLRPAHDDEPRALETMLR